MDVAALYIDVERGPYASIAGVDCWGVKRDARLYDGPWPVVAHPPCASWGNYRLNRLVLCRRRRWRSRDYDRSGAEMICGPIAVDQVRRFGGVLEHPARSGLFAFCGLPAPGSPADHYGGRTVEVWQGAHGHPAPKHTWLYIVGAQPEPGELRCYADPGRRGESLWSDERHLTPPAFARLLVAIARRARPTSPGRAARRWIAASSRPDVPGQLVTGENFRERERIKRKAARWRAKFEAMLSGERDAVLHALLTSIAESGDESEAPCPATSNVR